MVSWFLLPLVALSVILSLTDGRGLLRPVAVVMSPYGNPLMFMRDKRTPIGVYPQRAMILTGYYRPIRQSYNGDQATAVFAQGSAVNGAAYLGDGNQPDYLKPGPEPATEPEIANSEAEAAPQPEENSSAADEGDQNKLQGQGNQEHHNKPQDETNDSNPGSTTAPEESTETAAARPKKTDTKKGKKVVLPVQDEQEDEEDEDEYDDDITGGIAPLVPQKGKRRQQYPSRNIFFPMIFGYPGGSSRSGSSGSLPGSVTAIANSYSTGKGGVANSVATAYGGSPHAEFGADGTSDIVKRISREAFADPHHHHHDHHDHHGGGFGVGYAGGYGHGYHDHGHHDHGHGGFVGLGGYGSQGLYGYDNHGHGHGGHGHGGHGHGAYGHGGHGYGGYGNGGHGGYGLYPSGGGGNSFANSQANAASFNTPFGSASFAQGEWLNQLRFFLIEPLDEEARLTDFNKKSLQIVNETLWRSSALRDKLALKKDANIVGSLLASSPKLNAIYQDNFIGSLTSTSKYERDVSDDEMNSVRDNVENLARFRYFFEELCRRHMSEVQSTMPPSGSRSGGEGFDGDGADGRLPLTGSAGAMVMKSVSIFLARSRKASVSSRRQQLASPDQKQETVSKRRRRRPKTDLKMKSAAYYAKVIESLKKKTRFTKFELEALCKIYSKLTTVPKERVGHISSSSGSATPLPAVEGIDRSIFRELLHNTFDVITEDTIIERMFVYWDKDSEGAIRLEHWIMGLDVFLRGNQREKITFCFKVYDLNSDGYITKDEIFQLFKNCLIKQPGEEDPDEGVRDLSELALKKLDVDHDGKISFEDYEATVKEEPLLLEAFGQCLPTIESVAAFLMTLRP
ncbi:uncharacterized protein LOC117182699 [Belonocnema kinseyi]|uniref:uncharacterized protein LOC117182699 n=1 Tax=Belonocnema kinseyi TaxID=2817044 RepID=UPI00143DF25A|nr:uncharacterized protein LOC117182699 [Belonocnema kinseyi]